tara:strand:+ start:549 stop:764 length:216 start_codon:yes stop_codon:yes gene_type:complete
MPIRPENDKEGPSVDKNSQEAYQMLIEWVKTVPDAIEDIKKNGTKEDLKKYQFQIKKVVNKLKEIEADLKR